MLWLRIFHAVLSAPILADVAEKYHATELKITSAERIAIIGIKEEDVDKIWQDLDIRRVLL